MVETDRYVAAESAEGDHSAFIIADGVQYFVIHCLLRIPLLVQRQRIGKLSDCRHVVEDFGDIGIRPFRRRVDRSIFDKNSEIIIKEDIPLRCC